MRSALRTALGLSSLTRRLIVAILLVEMVLAALVTVAALFYQNRQSLQAFDVMLRGRADSVLGSVQDAEDPENNVLLDKTSIDVPRQDLFEVREGNGRFLGSSEAVSGAVPDQRGAALRKDLPDDGRSHDLKVSGTHYRGFVLHGVRLVDPETGAGVKHRVIIFYASPLKPVYKAFWKAARFFALTDLAAILVSMAAVAFVIRRSLRPLDALAAQAAAITPHSWNFRAPDSAHRLRELAPLASALDTALHGLERAFRQQRIFVGDAAHELKTAVTVLKSSLQLLTFRERTATEYEQGIELCLADTGRMEDLVQRMLMLARLEQHPQNGAAVVEPASTGLAEVVREVLSQMEAAARLKRLTLSAVAIEEVSVRVARDDAVTLLTNLVINAIQHTPAGSAITVRLEQRDKKFAVLSIADTGEGIAAEHLPFLFERFYRADASRSRDTGGTGLGLAICKAIVDAAGGQIAIESMPMVGTTVTVRLPIKQSISVLPNDLVQNIHEGNLVS